MMNLKDCVTYDCECLPNYFLFMALTSTDKMMRIERFDDKGFTQADRIKLLNLINNKRLTLVSFNGNSYDSVMMSGLIAGLNNKELKALNDDLIINSILPWDAESKYNFKRLDMVNHIDVMGVAPGVANLETYAARLHVRDLQRMPYSHDHHVTRREADDMVAYCYSDQLKLRAILEQLKPELEIREGLNKKYGKSGLDFRSFSDPKIAEKTFKYRLGAVGARVPIPDGTVADRFQEFFTYRPVRNFEFRSQALKKVKHLFENRPISCGVEGKPKIIFNWNQICFRDNASEKEFKLSGETDRKKWVFGKYNQRYESYLGKTKRGKPLSPEAHINSLKKGKYKFEFAGLGFTCGMGGLHSTESKVSHHSTDTHQIAEIDAAGFYPDIMIKNNFYPDTIGPVFTSMLSDIKSERDFSKAKCKSLEFGSNDWLYHNAGNQGGKVVSNGTFGKLSSPWSLLFDPVMLSQVTITGQLSILQFIEYARGEQFEILSANTDGAVIRYPKCDEKSLLKIISKWEKLTDMTMEITKYKSLYIDSVNNYIAVKEGEHKDCPNYSDVGYGVKGKGFYADTNDSFYALRNSPKNNISIIAAKRWLLFRVPLMETINACSDIKEFVTVCKVTGGAYHKGRNYGDVLRFAYSKHELGCITNHKGNKVPDSDQGVPLPLLPEALPAYLDYDMYHDIAVRHLANLGVDYER